MPEENMREVEEKTMCEEKNVICSLKRENGEWTFYDCNDKKLTCNDKKLTPFKRFPKAPLKNAYKDYRNSLDDKMPEESFACVWVLMGRENQTEKCIQVGRNSNLDNMLESDIIPAVKGILFGMNGKKKYSQLGEKCEYDTLTFYEVDIRAYIKSIKSDNNDLLKPIEPIKSFLEPNNTGEWNEYIKEAYYYVIAAYVEGKLGYDSKTVDNHCKYNPSKLDGYFYYYFKNSEKK